MVVEPSTGVGRFGRCTTRAGIAGAPGDTACAGLLARTCWLVRSRGVVAARARESWREAREEGRVVAGLGFGEIQVPDHRHPETSSAVNALLEIERCRRD